MLIHMEVSDREEGLDNKARSIPKRSRRRDAMRCDARPIKNLHHENVKQSTEGEREVGDACRQAAGSSFVALSADYPHQVYHTHTLKLIAHKCAIHNAQQAVSLLIRRRRGSW